MYKTQAPSTLHVGAARIAVWVALGSASWVILGTVVVLVMRIVG